MHRALVVAALLLSAPLIFASTASAMRCGNRLVVVGDASARVRGLCGEPAEITERVVERSRQVYVRGPNGSLIGDRVSVSVVVQRWVYDFGPQRFMRELVFEDGRLVQINTLGYGTERAELRPSSSARGERPLARSRPVRAVSG